MHAWLTLIGPVPREIMLRTHKLGILPRLYFVFERKPKVYFSCGCLGLFQKFGLLLIHTMCFPMLKVWNEKFTSLSQYSIACSWSLVASDGRLVVFSVSESW
jgi:hypothetical protein